MNIHTTIYKYYRAFIILLTLGCCGSACTYSEKTPIVQTIQVTEVVTKIVVQEVTQEVTRVVEIPVTLTPSETPLYTVTSTLTPSITSSPTITPTPEPSVVTILEHSDCFYGPGDVYLYKYSVLPGDQMEVVGRNSDGTWLYIEHVNGWNPCWIGAASVKFDNSNSDSVPFVTSRLPFSYYHLDPDATARRVGSQVKVSWKAIWMSFDDYRGYLIEAWVCQSGHPVFVPIGFIPPLADNTGILTVTVTDEPGCTVPSRARIYTAHRQGYSPGSDIPWPP